MTIHFNAVNTSSSANNKPSTTTTTPARTSTIPRAISTADGQKLYVVENDVYHQCNHHYHQGGGRGGAAARRHHHASSSPHQLPEMTASLADFSVVDKSEGEEPRTAKIDESEWVLLS